jgi:two-component system, cell cycle response regulator DivK
MLSNHYLAEEYCVSNLQALIVDDNPNNIEILVMFLAKEGVNHTAVQSVKLINQTLRDVDKFDIVFLDLEFPNGNGFELLKRLKTDSRFTDVPIVAYSVHTSEIDRVRRAGFHSFIGKPLNSQRFPNQLNRILNGESVWEV